ncbi:hypothetical protein YB2330_000141 [Saitoella coloradoensis]
MAPKLETDVEAQSNTVAPSIAGKQNTSTSQHQKSSYSPPTGDSGSSGSSKDQRPEKYSEAGKTPAIVGAPGGGEPSDPSPEAPEEKVKSGVKPNKLSAVASQKTADSQTNQPDIKDAEKAAANPLDKNPREQHDAPTSSSAPHGSGPRAVRENKKERTVVNAKVAGNEGGKGVKGRDDKGETKALGGPPTEQGAETDLASRGKGKSPAGNAMGGPPVELGKKNAIQQGRKDQLKQEKNVEKEGYAPAAHIDKAKL